MFYWKPPRSGNLWLLFPLDLVFLRSSCHEKVIKWNFFHLKRYWMKKSSLDWNMVMFSLKKWCFHLKDLTNWEWKEKRTLKPPFDKFFFFNTVVCSWNQPPATPVLEWLLRRFHYDIIDGPHCTIRKTKRVLMVLLLFFYRNTSPPDYYQTQNYYYLASYWALRGSPIHVMAKLPPWQGSRIRK